MSELINKYATPDQVAGIIDRIGHEHIPHIHQQMSVRRANHNGHEIKLTTHYTLEIDGEEVTAMLHVGDDGHVYTHATPNLGYSSALDLVRNLIDLGLLGRGETA